MKALFVHDRDDLHADIPGGVQLCTREFLEVVSAASGRVALLEVPRASAPGTRLRRKLRLGSYLGYDPAGFGPLLRQAIAAEAPTHVFLNRSELVRLAPIVRQALPSAFIAVMSHGNQSGDDLYEIAGPQGRRTGLSRLAATWQLGLDLVTESWHRHRHLDGVCVMSQEEAVLERWLGARRTLVLPRLMAPAPLDWQPVAGRAGYVGTLDHTPNRAALVSLCEELRHAAKPPELRLAGGPEAAGRELAARYPFITYVGRLPDAALAAEAASWSVFLNPIFWLARGASMKLRQGLAWGLPVLTTEAGRRGYEWREDAVPTTPDLPAAFARRLLAVLASPEAVATARTASLAAARGAPSVTELAGRLAAWSRDPSP
ncbi:MAG TPA: glycosyltransferase [Opitutaceae bacterium]